MTTSTVTATSPAVRRRVMVSLFAGVACMSIGMVSASTVGSLIAAELAGPAWSGLPGASGVIGTAAGSLLSGTVTSRRGARFSLLSTYSLGLAGAAVAITAALISNVALLMAGMVLLGLGNGGAQQSRYRAAELFPENRRGLALSSIVWAGTVGALVGPNLIAPAANAAGTLQLPRLSGPVMVTSLALCGALLVSALLPRVLASRRTAPGAGSAPMRLRATLTLPAVAVPLVAMVTAQLAMVAVMTMTPVQLHQHGHGLDIVGWVLSAHMVGMFALAPLSGRIADRFGPRVTIYFGIACLVAAAGTVILAPTAYAVALPIALFLLGYGWNLSLVGGSTMLSRDLPAEQRARSQGTIDAFVWGSSALASISSGALFGLGGYVLVASVAGALVLVPLALLRRR